MEEPPISELLSAKRGKKKKTTTTTTEGTAKKKKKKKDAPVPSANAENPSGYAENCNGEKITVLAFDESVENHFKAIDAISKLCGETCTEEDDAPIEESEIKRLSSSITFIRFTMPPNFTHMYVCMNVCAILNFS